MVQAAHAVQAVVAEQAGADPSRLKPLIDNGAAIAALASDHQDAETLRLQGSPVPNDGRQKLYGNAGFRIIEANVQELLREPKAGQASWC